MIGAKQTLPVQTGLKSVESAKYSRQMVRTSERIALFVADLEGGGAERVMVTLANGFHRGGYTVDLVLQRATGPYLKDVSKGVTVVDLKAARSFLSLLPLIRYLRKTRPNTMFSTLSNVNIIAVLAWIIARVPGRLVVREAITTSVDDRSSAGIRSKMISLMRRKAYQRANHVVAPSIGVAEDLIENVGVDRARVSVICNPIDISLISALASEPVEHLQTLPSNTQVVLGVGRLFPQKDFTTLIRAFSKVCQTRNAVLFLLGEGEEREHLNRLVLELGLSGKVFMPGFVENPFAYMKHAAVFVLSSRYEGLPNALLQALAVGTPVVATDCPSGPREILEGGRWGRLVPVGDVAAMAQAIVEGLNGRLKNPPVSLIKERYGVEGIIKQYLNVLLPSVRE